MSAPLTVTTSIKITLDGEVYDFENKQSLLGVTSVYNQTFPVPITEIGIATVAAEFAAGTFKDFNFIYLENKDTVNFCQIAYKKASGDTAYYQLDAGRSIYFWNNKLNVSESGAAFDAFVDWDSVLAKADTETISLKVFGCQVI
jgi:hypothetical protein